MLLKDVHTVRLLNHSVESTHLGMRDVKIVEAH